MRRAPNREVWVRVLGGVIMLCCWVRYFTLTVPPSTQVLKWVPANCWGQARKIVGSWGWGAGGDL